MRLQSVYGVIPRILGKGVLASVVLRVCVTLRV